MRTSQIITIGSIIAVIGYFISQIQNWDLLTAMDENLVLGGISLQLSVLAFCLTSADSALDMVNGHVEEEDYSKQSIYSILYSLYDYLGTIESENENESFIFTFNTWGIESEPPLFPHTDPQRYGKTAYKSLILFGASQKLISFKHKNNEKLRILEVGCGTGAGADLITTEIQKDFTNIDIEYIALDMQLAAMNICKKLHESQSLKCIQGNGKNLVFENDTFDIVIVSETHIAEIDIDEETKVILSEISRVLKDGGLFLWGNALRTHTWNDINNYLPSIGYESCGINDVTKEAIEARKGDIGRAKQVWHAIENKLHIFQWMPKCGEVTKLLIMNFYRMPGTNLFNTMVNGTDSYMQICNRIQKS